MASYEWLKATLFQAKEKKDRTEEEQDFIAQRLTKTKDKNRTPQQAKRDFIDSCQWSWNTEDCLKLMKEGLVPYDIVNSIIQETWGITNKFFSIFNSKASLQSLIGSKHIAILGHGQDILALDPSDKQEKNNERIEQFFAKIEETKKIRIITHGTGGYAKSFPLLMDGSKRTVVFYPSNIPNWGPIATINGSKKRINEHKDNIKKIIDKNREKGNQETSNETKIAITSYSYGNAMGVECSRILADDLDKKHILTIEKVARDFFIFQSAEYLFNSINAIKKKNNIALINLFSENDFLFHPASKTLWLRDKLEEEKDKNNEYQGINIRYERAEDAAEREKIIKKILEQIEKERRLRDMEQKNDELDDEEKKRRKEILKQIEKERRLRDMENKKNENILNEIKEEKEKKNIINDINEENEKKSNKSERTKNGTAFYKKFINKENLYQCNSKENEKKSNKSEKNKKFNNRTDNKIEEYGRRECNNVGDINNTLTINNKKNKGNII